MSIDEPKKLAEDDFTTGIGVYFPSADAAEPFKVDYKLSGLVGSPLTDSTPNSSTVAAVVWEYTGVHEKDAFAGIPATGQTVTFRGVTVVDNSGDVPQYSRYIDWMFVMAQLGLTATMRPVLAPPKT